MEFQTKFGILMISYFPDGILEAWKNFNIEN